MRASSIRLPVLNRRALLESLGVPSDEFLSRCKTGLPALTDSLGRSYSYLRVSVVDRCDLACVYCMPTGGELDRGVRAELLSFEEVVRIAKVFSEMGVRRLRLTGGEPLVRKDLVSLVNMISKTAIEEIAMTSNATQLGRLAEPLAAAGLKSVNVSLDTICPDIFAKVTRGGDVSEVLEGIDAALAAGLHVKVNAIALRWNEDPHDDNERLRDLVSYCWTRGITPRFIELMPLGEAAKLSPRMRRTPDDVKGALGDILSDRMVASAAHTGPAHYFGSADGEHRVGFISAVSDEFCGSCNRIRVTSHGEIRACLASRTAVSLRDLIRDGCDDVTLAWAAHCSLFGKAKGHTFTSNFELEHHNVGMSLIGG